MPACKGMQRIHTRERANDGKRERESPSASMKLQLAALIHLNHQAKPISH